MTFAALLLTALLFGGMTLYSFGLAPLVFSQLQADTAGRFLRGAFPWYYLFIVAAAVAAALTLAPIDGPAAITMAVVAVLGIVARQVLMPRINSARDAQLAGDAAAKARFGRLHGLSVAINFVQLAAVAWILARFI